MCVYVCVCVCVRARMYVCKYVRMYISVWVKAHAGTLGNEVADMLAKEAARSENMQYVFDRIPKSTLQHKAEAEAKKE